MINSEHLNWLGPIVTVALLLVLSATSEAAPQEQSMPQPPIIADTLSAEPGEGHSVAEQAQQPNGHRDIWDRLESFSALIAGLIVALVGGAATWAHNRRQIAIMQVQAVDGFMDYLVSNDQRSVRIALSALKALGNVDLAAELAEACEAPASVEFLEILSSDPDPEIATKGRRSLVVVRNRIESEALRKLRLVCRDMNTTGREIADYIFAAGSDYGYNVLPSERELMLNEGWIEAHNGSVVVTESGRRRCSEA